MNGAMNAQLRYYLGMLASECWGNGGPAIAG